VPQGAPVKLKVCLVGFVLLVALVVLTPLTAQAQTTAYAYVPNAGPSTVSVIETRSNTVVGPAIPTGGTFPTSAVATPDGRKVYVSHAGIGANTIVSIDVVTGTVSAPITVGTQPKGMALLPDGSKLYVANISSGTVSVINTSTDTVTKTLGMGSNPLSVAVSPDGLRAYVSSNGGDGVVRVIDTTTDTVLLPIPVLPPAGGLVVTQDSGRLYVVEAGGAKVNVWDLDLAGIVAMPTVGLNPNGISRSPDGTQMAVSDFIGGAVSLIDVATNAVTDVTFGGGFGGHGSAYSPDGSTLYAIRYEQGDVRVIDPIAHNLNPTPIAVGVHPYSLTDFMTPLIVTTTCTGCGGTALSIASDADLTPLGVKQYLVFNAGILRLTGNWTTTRHLSVLSGGATIDTQGFTATIAGNVINPGVLNKQGTGTLTLNGTATHDTTDLSEGTLIVNGGHSGNLTTTTGTTLGGTGTIGHLNAAGGGTLAPGVNGPGILHASTVTLGPTTHLAIQLNGAVAGTGYDRLDASTSATLGNATLDLTAGFTPAAGTVFTIVTHATGTFAGLADNALINVGGTILRLSYHGGTGSDVTLTLDPPPPVDGPPTIAGLTNQTIAAGSTMAPQAFTIGDDFTPVGSLTLGATSSNHALLPDANIVFGVSGAARTVSATPVPSASGVTTITSRSPMVSATPRRCPSR
jgi:YVTN family beta-propeller protein